MPEIISWETKVWIYITIIKLTLIYGCEAWTEEKDLEKTLGKDEFEW